MISWLYVPGDRPDRFEKAVACGAYGVIFDLEDAVRPDSKGTARTQVGAFLQHAKTPVRLAVRVNATGAAEHVADVTMVRECGAILVLPKCESASDLVDLTGAVPLLESARGVINAAEIGAAQPECIMVGLADLSADLGCAPTAAVASFATHMVLLHAAANRVPVIASPYFDLGNQVGLREYVTAAKANGFAGVAAIHPQQIAVIEEVFHPTDAEVAAAQAIVNVAGVGVIDGQMTDAAMARRAHAVLERARCRKV